MGQLKFQSSTTGCFWMLPWFLVRDVPTQVSILHNWLWMLPWFLMRDGPTQVSILHNWFMDVTMVPHERWANSSFNPPQLVVYGCFHGSSWEMGQLKFQITHNWLFIDVTMVPHERWANSSFNQPQLVVYRCYHGSSWEMGQLKFQSTTTGCL